MDESGMEPECEVRVLPASDPSHDRRAEAQLAALRALLQPQTNLVRDISGVISSVEK